MSPFAMFIIALVIILIWQSGLRMPALPKLSVSGVAPVLTFLRKISIITLAWGMFALALLINFPAFFKEGFWGLWELGIAKVFLIATTVFLVVVIWKKISEMMWYAIFIIAGGFILHHIFFADELVERHTLQPGEIWESSVISYVAEFRAAEENREYLVKLPGCTVFSKHSETENGELIKVTPCQPGPGRIEFKLPSGEKRPLEIRIYKRR